jgi:hypothetical protein
MQQVLINVNKVCILRMAGPVVLMMLHCMLTDLMNVDNLFRGVDTEFPVPFESWPAG